jgi:diguanylate cyclase
VADVLVAHVLLAPVSAPAASLPLAVVPIGTASAAIVIAVASVALVTAAVLELRHRRQLARLRTLLGRDPLTGVASRHALDEHLAKVDPQSTAVLFVDLNGFKQINDVHGHDVGDEVLRIAGVRLGGVLRGGDVVGRRGGDEFLAVCRITDADDADIIAGRLLSCFRAPFVVGDLSLDVSASVGMATASGPTAMDVAHLVRQADLAMYRAKRSRLTVVPTAV